MKTIPIVAKVVNVQSTPTFPNPLPIGYPVELARDWNHALNPHAIGVWVQYLSNRLLLGYLPESIATLVANDMEAGTVVSTSILQYMRVREEMMPVISVKIEVIPHAQPVAVR